MFRTIFVVGMLAAGWTLALQSTFYAACLYLWIAYFRPESWAWSDIFTTLNLSYFAGAYLVLRTILSGYKFTLDWRSGLLVLFLVHSLVSSLLGPNPAHSMSYWQDFAKTIVISYLLTTIIKSTAELRIVLMVITLSLGFEAVKQGYANMLLHPGGKNLNGVPFLGDNNLVAVGMAMLVPIITALSATSTGWQKRLFQFMSAGVVYRGLSTYSRGGFISFGAIGAMHFWRSPHKLRTVVAIALIAALVLPVLPQEFWTRMSTITVSTEEQDESALGRLHFWEVAVAMANDRPFVGVGHSGYPRVYNQYDWTGGQFLTNRAVHSAWFGVLAESGYPGLVLFAAIIFGSFRACRRVRLAAQRGETNAALGPYAIALESSLVAFIVGGSFVSFQYCEMLWHFFALTIALERVAVAEAVTERIEQPQPVEAPATPAEADFVWT
ncbi:MAG TPA: putative O-glycosylation ligase, exosortase A system-associated [Vicinamibacterales bacterium]|nr:putative O-glycosylation ligase, exosortase A system-associated [Vicinamibacterales bacterium]